MKVVCANFTHASNCRKMGRNDDIEKGVCAYRGSQKSGTNENKD